MYGSNLFLVLVFGLSIWTSAFASMTFKCPCAQKSECERIINRNDRSLSNNTIGYILETDESIWSKFSWDKLTMVSLVDFHNDRMMCLAHRNKVQIMSLANFTLNDLTSEARMETWLANQLNSTKTNFYDGINLFIDDPVEKDSIESKRITKFVQLVANRFHQELPGSVVLFNLPYSPYNEKSMFEYPNAKSNPNNSISYPELAVDGKNYDFVAISKSTDLMVIMDFDQRRQSFDEPQCLAGSPMSLYITIGSLMAYQRLGIDMTRVILTLGFYVDEYLCVEYHQNYRCIIEPSSYLGSNCSSQVAKRIPWNIFEAMKMSGDCWRAVVDEHSGHELYTRLDDTCYGAIRQYWSAYPTVYSELKLINDFNLSGFGAWTLNFLTDKVWDDMPQRLKEPEI